MLSLTVQIEGSATPALRAVIARMEDAEGLHEAMGMAVRDRVQSHIASTKSSPHTGWWGRAARSLKHESSATEASVYFTQRGVALRHYGGTVYQKEGGPLLTIPGENVPVVDGTRKAPREMEPLAFLPARRPARKGVVGVLVEGELTGKTIKTGKRAGQPATRPKPGGSLLYTLMTEVSHSEDPTVLPTEAELLDAAGDAAADFLATF